ncbi:hypothetical protein Ait01nite_049630 [Actinoplanes italicus]|uniref:Pycsar system effector family protein n=1 Tax=Actinoplanes italicus TaxID=113567 RepID=UPI000D07288E|nr:Pycsar system effector family protein [Actinoplanes italicus]GIE31918.1 hypothetical protein Ait01nite_049630 [Actinoplanes italicus]
MLTELERTPTNLDVAWRTHVAQESWAGKVDTKASILLTLNGVILGAVLSARVQKDSFIAVLAGPRAVMLAIAVVLCATAGLLAAGVIYPVLGRGHRNGSNRPDPAGTIYFGDLRLRRPAELAGQLATMTTEEQFGQVARQLVAMARAAWLKHRLLQAALVATTCGFLMIMAVMLT